MGTQFGQGDHTFCSHDYVLDERSAVPGCVQLPLVCSCEHDGHHHVSLVPFHCSRRQVQECCAHLWVDAYHYSVGKVEGGALEMQAPTLTGIPFNDAYRYMDWLLTVPLLLIEILLVMKLDDATFSSKAWNLGVGSALMIASGYYGELVVTGDLTPRWMCWFISM